MVTKDTWLKFMQNKVLNRLVTWFILPVGVGEGTAASRRISVRVLVRDYRNVI